MNAPAKAIEWEDDRYSRDIEDPVKRALYLALSDAEIAALVRADIKKDEGKELACKRELERAERYGAVLRAVRDEIN